ncbi:MAG TPA: hypothetical protein PKN78_02765, partial [Tenuifilaceae bacterium]|nr:hypothetical protein [Tenuifilaceae bacterium]
VLLRALCGAKDITTEDTEERVAETLAFSVLFSALCGKKNPTTEDTEERVAETLTLSVLLVLSVVRKT